MPRNRYPLLAAALAALLVPALAGPAQAAPPPVQDHYSAEFDELLPGPGGWFCGGLVDVPLHTEIDGYFSIKERASNELLYFADRFRSTLAYTNPETGLTYTVVRDRQMKDLRLTDNGDGTLTLVGLSTGALFTYGPDGERLDIRAGLSRETFLVDTMGTADPIDDVLTPVGDPVTAGLDTTTDFCTDFFEATQG
jgi:hypothetical protein